MLSHSPKTLSESIICVINNRQRYGCSLDQTQTQTNYSLCQIAIHAESNMKYQLWTQQNYSLIEFFYSKN